MISHGRAAARKRSTRRFKRDKGAEIHSLAELTPGDYVVHAAHGIGIYDGIQQLEMQGVVKDYIKLRYDKGDTLYVPVTQLDLVSKYIGTKDEVRVKLHRLAARSGEDQIAGAVSGAGYRPGADRAVCQADGDPWLCV